MKRWEKVQELKYRSESLTAVDGVYRLTVKGNKLIVEKEVETDLDITSACRITYRESQHSDGYYIALTHGRHDVAIFGVKDTPVVMGGYELRRPDKARVSFRVYKLSR